MIVRLSGHPLIQDSLTFYHRSEGKIFVAKNGSFLEKEFLPVLQGVKLSKTQNPTMAENRKRMKIHSLCLSHMFYKVCYVMYEGVLD